MNKNYINVLPFETSNNKYLFDGISSEVIPSSDIINEIIFNFYNKTKEELYKNVVDKIQFSDFEQKYNLISKMIIKGMFYQHNQNQFKLDYDIKENIYKDSSSSYLIIVLTEKCNMRCEYCVYSDKYPKEISYSDKDLDFDTAKKAVDDYFELHNMRVKHGFQKPPMIMFYGGEPLIKFAMIKQIVEYIKTINEETIYYITTNALLLNDEVAKFFSLNNFSVTISLDGFKENHDRNRVTVGREPTFDKVITNIKNFQKIKKDLGITRMLSFNCCYDNYTNIYDCVEFFEQNYESLSPFIVFYAPINPYDTTYYTWTKERIDNGEFDLEANSFNEGLKRIRDIFFDETVDRPRFKNAALNLFLGEYALSIRNKWLDSRYNNCCVPLAKLTVYPDGTYTLCEKMNKKLPVGSANKGIDFMRVKEFSDKLSNTMSSKCSMCTVKKLCSACFQYMSEAGEINSDFCKNERAQLKKRLTNLYELAERHPNYLKLLHLDDESMDILNILN